MFWPLKYFNDKMLVNTLKIIHHIPLYFTNDKVFLLRICKGVTSERVLRTLFCEGNHLN